MLLVLCWGQPLRSSWLHSCSPPWEINGQGQVHNSCPGAGGFSVPSSPSSAWMFDNSLSPASLVEGHVSFHTRDKRGLEWVLLYVWKAALAAWKIKWPVVTWLCIDCWAMSLHKDGCQFLNNLFSKFNISITYNCSMDMRTWYFVSQGFKLSAVLTKSCSVFNFFAVSHLVRVGVTFFPSSSECLILEGSSSFTCERTWLVCWS